MAADDQHILVEDVLNGDGFGRDNKFTNIKTKTFTFLQIDIIHEVNRIPYAEIEIQEDEDTKGNRQIFKTSNSGRLVLGKKVKIKLNTDNTAVTEDVFRGVITRNTVRSNEQGSSFTVEIRDPAYAMTVVRKSRIWTGKTFNEIFKDLVSKYNDVKIDLSKFVDNVSSSPNLTEVQHNCSDWDFLVSRAEALGYLIFVQQGNIKVCLPEILEEKPDLKNYHLVDFRTDKREFPIFDIQLEADAYNQYNEIKVWTWDIENQQLSRPSPSTKPFNYQTGNYSSKDFSTSLGGEKSEIFTYAPLPEDEVREWEKAQRLKNHLSVVRGRFYTEGNPYFKIGHTLEFQGVSKELNGRTFISGVRHQLTGDGWNSDVQFGISSEWFIKEDKVMDLPAAGILPGVAGLQVGIVREYEDGDPEKQFRIPVMIPNADPDRDKKHVWARIASLYAGAERGIFFPPEPGDEVVLGYFNDDPRHPVILGSMFSKPNSLPLPTKIDGAETTELSFKGIITKNGTQILFNEDEKRLRFIVDEKQTMEFDSTDKSIRIIDDINEQCIELSPDGILIDSAKDLIIKVQGNMKLEVGEKLEIKAKDAVSIKGSKLDLL